MLDVGGHPTTEGAELRIGSLPSAARQHRPAEGQVIEPHVTPLSPFALTTNLLDDENMPVRAEMTSIGSGAVLPEKLRQLLAELRAGQDEVGTRPLGRFSQL